MCVAEQREGFVTMNLMAHYPLADHWLSISTMPDNNNRYIKNDLQVALDAAELRINQFRPPSIGSDPPQEGTPFHPDITQIQREVATKSALERTNALFDVLMHFITQGASDEINRQQLMQKISRIETRLDTLEQVLTRNHLI